MKIPSIKQLRQALKIYYSEPQINIFKKFRAGLIYFTVGMMIIILANQNMESSLTRDLVTLLGLSLAAIGFLMAILSHIRLVISRIVQFFIKK